MSRRGPISDLSGEQRDILAILAREGPIDRFALKQDIQRERLDRVTNATVYNHLETLSEQGLVSKWSGQGSGDDSSNQYRIGRDGLRTLTAHYNWLDECLSDAAPIVGVDR